RIDAMLADGEDRAFDQEIELPMPAVQAPGPAPAQTEAVAAAGVPTDCVRSLRFEQGTSSKFWRASLRGTELNVTYGRIGSAGQAN
ncbi:WGR domain-containing protein, partial [Psychrobacter sp. SIMBA_152]